MEDEVINKPKPVAIPRRLKTRDAVLRQIDRANEGITKLKMQIQTIEDAKELMIPVTMRGDRRKLTDQADALWNRITYLELRLKRLQHALAMFDMKNKRKTVLIAPIREERILKLSNDLSEGINSGTIKEWRAVAYYFRNRMDAAHNDINDIRPTVAAYVAGRNILSHAGPEMEQWLKRVKS